MKYPFSIETNATWGQVLNELDWLNHIENVKKLYNLSDEEAVEHLLRSRIKPDTLNDPTPCFGLYAEYNGDLTLKEWANQ